MRRRVVTLLNDRVAERVGTTREDSRVKFARRFSPALLSAETNIETCVPRRGGRPIIRHPRQNSTRASGGDGFVSRDGRGTAVPRGRGDARRDAGRRRGRWRPRRHERGQLGRVHARIRWREKVPRRTRARRRASEGPGGHRETPERSHGRRPRRSGPRLLWRRPQEGEHKTRPCCCRSGDETSFALSARAVRSVALLARSIPIPRIDIMQAPITATQCMAACSESSCTASCTVDRGWSYLQAHFQPPRPRAGTRPPPAGVRTSTLLPHSAALR